MSERKTELRALTSARFFAAAYVFCFHATTGREAGAIPDVARTFFRNGYVGVSFFFVLSGFILTYTYASQTTHLPWRPFLSARFARIAPVYALGWLLWSPAAAMTSLAKNGLAVGLAKLSLAGTASLLLVQAWVPKLALYWNPPGWSLAVEAFFYVLFPLILARLTRATSPGLVAIVVGSGLAALVFPGIYLVLDPDGVGPASPDVETAWIGLVKFDPVMHLPEFVCGCAWGLLFVRRAAAPSGARSSVVSSLLAISIATVLALPIRGLYLLLHNGLLAPLFGALIYRLGDRGDPIARVLSHRPLVFLGGASYGIYILQAPVGWLLWKAFDLAGRPMTGGRAFAVHLVCVTAAASASFVLVEEPCRRGLRGLLGSVRSS